MQVIEKMNRALAATGRSLRVIGRDVGHGLLEVSHNTLALLGLVAITVLVLAGGRPEVRQQLEVLTLAWLQDRHAERELASGNVLSAVAEPDAVMRATAIDPKALTREQAAVARWLARRYKVAPEPVGALVAEAWAIGERARIDPTLILAIMAVESSFNPFAQSAVGAQGLMQVMTRVHDDKYEVFGGNHAAFDPITNLRVGVQVLKECIARAGSVQAGLRFYVGAALLDHDGGYTDKVLLEQAHLQNVAAGRQVAFNASNRPPPAPAAAEPALETADTLAPATPSETAPAAVVSSLTGGPLRVALLH